MEFAKGGGRDGFIDIRTTMMKRMPFECDMFYPLLYMTLGTYLPFTLPFFSPILQLRKGKESVVVRVSRAKMQIP